jgi:hypothetical protein
MSKIFQLRRDNSDVASRLVCAEGELFVDLTEKSIRVHDGITKGGELLVTNSMLKTVLLNVVGTDRFITTKNGISGGGPLLYNQEFSLTGQALKFHELIGTGLVARSNSGNIITKNIIGQNGISVKNSFSNADDIVIELDGSIVRAHTRVHAGNGLEGGGDLTGNVFINLGLPSTITGNTYNSVTGSSHTHELNISWSDISNKPIDQYFIEYEKSLEISTTDVITIDTFNKNTYRSGRYVLQISEENWYQIHEFHILHDGIITYISNDSVNFSTHDVLADVIAKIEGENVVIRYKKLLDNDRTARVKMKTYLVKD